MENLQATENIVLVNRIREIMARKGLTEGMVRGIVFDAGYSSNVSDRLIAGETGFTTSTLRKLSIGLGLDSISELIDIEYQKPTD